MVSPVFILVFPAFPLSSPPEFWGELPEKWVVKGTLSSLPFVGSSGHNGSFLGVLVPYYTCLISASYLACSLISPSEEATLTAFRGCLLLLMHVFYYLSSKPIY
jgi:hypothetical protein